MVRWKRATIVYYYYNEPYWASITYIKEGKRYIYFRDSFDREEVEHKIEKEKVRVFLGERKDIVEKVESYRKEISRYNSEKEEYMRQVEWEAYRYKLEKLNEWSKTHPYPKVELS